MARPSCGHASSDQPNSCTCGPTNNDGSATRPAITTFAPAASASTIGSAPMRIADTSWCPSADTLVPVSAITASRSRTSFNTSSPVTVAIEATEPKLLGDVLDDGSGGRGICGAHVGDDGGAVLDTRRQQGSDPVSQERIVAGLWTAHPGLLREGNSAFGQALEHEVVEVAACRELDRWIEPVARESRAATDPERLHSGTPEQDAREGHHNRGREQIWSRVALMVAELDAGEPTTRRSLASAG